MKITKKTRIYCDMDGVLVNIHTTLLKEMNGALNPDRASRKMWKRAQKAAASIPTTRFSGEHIILRHGQKKNTAVQSLVYSILAKNKDLWINLPWTRDGKRLWKFISPMKPRILSAPVDDDCIAGKKIWIRENLGIPPGRIFIMRDKFVHATNSDGSSNILIDDFSKNTAPWKAHGGIAILHTSTKKTISLLKFILS